MSENHNTFWESMWRQYKHHKLGMLALFVVAIFFLVGIYAPFLASSKPFAVNYDGQWFFPLFRYLFYRGFYTKLLDIFFNLLIFTFPLIVLSFYLLKGSLRRWVIVFLCLIQCGAFVYFVFAPVKDPAADPLLTQQRVANRPKVPNWAHDVSYMTPYERLNLVLHHQLIQRQHDRLLPFAAAYEKKYGHPVPTLWQTKELNERRQLEGKDSPERQYLIDRRQWLDEQMKLIHFELMPLIRDFHWEDDAGGGQNLNQFVPWWELTRINRKDLVAALIFGVRISLVVGILAVSLALIIGVPIGAFAGYYGGTSDIVVSRLLEIWESMPTFFMLLLVVAITQSKSIFIVIAVIGLFGWTTFSRYIRGEFFKQRNLSYVEACHSLGFKDSYIMFSHVLPNAIPPLLTLLPFAIMAAITSEAGLSFLGLGEENSASWGVLMDEGRSAFPGESYLLWPPAILLTILLVSIALVGDSLRDALDPKLHR